MLPCCCWQLLRCFVLAAKLVIISNNTPPIKKSEIEYYAMLSKTGVHHYTGSEHVKQISAAFIVTSDLFCRADYLGAFALYDVLYLI